MQGMIISSDAILEHRTEVNKLQFHEYVFST